MEMEGAKGAFEGVSSIMRKITCAFYHSRWDRLSLWWLHFPWLGRIRFLPSLNSSSSSSSSSSFYSVFFFSCLFILPASHLVLSVFCPPFFSGSCSTNASQSQDWSSPVTCFSVIGPPPPPGSAYLREAPPISHLAQRCGGATLLSPAAPHDVTDQLNI